MLPDFSVLRGSVFVCFGLISEMISVCSLGWPGAYYVDQDLKFRDPSLNFFLSSVVFQNLNINWMWCPMLVNPGLARLR